MENTITAQEIKRRGISAVDDALQHGPVHVIQRNRARYVILSEHDYQRLSRRSDAQAELWQKLLQAPESNGRSKTEIDQQLAEERGSWAR